MSDTFFDAPFRCWQPAATVETMPMDAASPHDGVFFATHQPTLALKRGIGEEGGAPVAEESILDDLERARQDIVLLPVTGEAGTGKSHFVRWLYRRLEVRSSNERRRIVYIPKSDTNLRAVIGLILEGLEGEAFDKLRSDLTTAVEQLDENVATKFLVNQLALKVETTPAAEDEPDYEIRSHLRANLRPLLADPWFEERFIAPGGVVDRLVREALHGRGTDDKDEPFEFRGEDFNLTIAEISQAGLKARNLYQLLHGNLEVRRVAADLLNEQLQPAIQRLFGVSDRQLFDVMIEARQELLRRGYELFLFIEDFTILQGIQRDLLDAMVNPPEHFIEAKRLCPIRVVMAVTTGYFRRLGLQTVATRAGFEGNEYNLDVEIEVGGEFDWEHLYQFVGRYLNAARQGAAVLNGAYDAVAEDPSAWVPNACETCKNKAPCHAGFGSTESGYGLYPFNREALGRMVESQTGGRFDPRKIMGRVLYYTLFEHSDDVLNQTFPSDVYLERFLHGEYAERFAPDPQMIAALERVAPGRGKKLANVYAFWGDRNDSVSDVATPVFEAFMLERPSVEISLPRKSERKRTEPEEDAHGPLNDDLGELRAWSLGGHQLDQRLTLKLRRQLYASVMEHIPWGTLLRRETDWASSQSGRLRLTSFQIANAGAGALGTDTIVVPIEAGPETALLLQDVIRFLYHRGWNFPTGAEALVRYQGCVDRWAQEVISQLTPPSADLAIAVEDLVIEGRVLGLDSASDRPEALLEVLFTPAPQILEQDGRSPEWTKLLALAAEEGGRAAKRTELRAFVLAAASASQGASGQPIACDVTAVLPALKEAARTWEPRAADPSTRKKLEAHHKSLRERLPEAVDRERARLLDWASKIEHHFGSTSLQDVARALLESAHAAVTAGVFRPGGGDQKLRSAVRSAAAVAEAIDRAPALAAELTAAKPGKALALIAENRENAIAATTEMIAESERFLRETAASVDREVSDQGSGASGGDRAQEVLDALDALETNLATALALEERAAGEDA